LSRPISLTLEQAKKFKANATYQIKNARGYLPAIGPFDVHYTNDRAEVAIVLIAACGSYYLYMKPAG